MAKESNETLKTYFETADVPTAAEFANLVESKIGILAAVENLPTAAATNLGDKYLIGTTLYTCTLAGSTYSWTGTAWGGGVTAYTDLTSKPTVNAVELTGNKTSAQLKVLGTELTGITALGAFASTDIVYVRRGSTWYYGTYADMQTGMIAMIPANLSGTEITTQGSGIVVTIAGSKIGDQYINTSTGNLYKCVATDTWDWIITLKGVDGADGATWISGTAVPTTEGVDGDYYLRTTNYEIYKKTSGTWNSIGNIKGIQGEVGSVTFFGTAVTGTGTGIEADVTESKAGDVYKNTDTGNYYLATEANTWDYKGCDKIDFSSYSIETTIAGTDYVFCVIDGINSIITFGDFVTAVIDAQST